MRGDVSLNIWLVMCCFSVEIICRANITLAEEPVFFADTNLKVVIEQSLGNNNPTPADMLALTELVAMHKNITDLKGLEYAVNMQYLDLRYNLISDVSTLSVLTNLTELDLGYNQISDINNLSGLTNLAKLRLRENQISDISALSYLTNLTELSLYENEVVDVSPLTNLTNLTELILMRNQIVDIEPLANLTNLTNLHVSKNKIENIDCLSGLTNLTQLGLGFNSINDIDVLKNLTKLTWLNLVVNEISNIETLGFLQNLDQLFLTDNRIVDISSVSDLTNLTYLTLGNNQISVINAISPLTKLTYLDLANNQISSVTLLSDLCNLKYLYLQHNQLSDISAISAFSKLEYLHLYHNDIRDVDSLSGLTNLIEVRMDDNRIVDIFPLTNLTNLRILDLQGNPLNQDAYDIYIPHISENNPGIDLKYDPYIEATIYIDDDAAGDPGPNNPIISDRNENGTLAHPFDMIQEGIDAAADGDVILVYPGLYHEEINFLGKMLTVQGVAISPTGVPVLRNPGDFAVSFYSGEGPDSVLKNFIITDSFMGVFIVDSSPTISNLTIVGNKYGIEAYAGSEPDISNSILWNNTDGDLFGCQARYSCIERGVEGEGNISHDPLFVDPGNDDYHIRSKRGRYWPEYDIWVLDKVTSPCVDGGDPNLDPSDEPLPNGRRINIGAYGGTLEASMSPIYFYTKYSGGSGTVEDPYQISTEDDLMLLGDNPEDYDKHFILTADIDLDPTLPGRKVFDKAVIAPDRIPDMYGPFDGIPFAGAFEGNEHTISHLTIIGESYLGLFGQLGPEAIISNIGLEAVDIDGIGIFIGGLVGYNNGNITKSYCTGTVSGAYGVGGLASYSDGRITACYSTGTVSGSTDVGGLVGYNAGIISSSHCSETVTGDENVGGLVGYNYSVKLGEGIITTSYSTGSVFGRRSCIGGLVGRNQGSITTSYSISAVRGTSIPGGLVGWNARGGSIISSFWDVENSGKSNSDGGIGKTTPEMQTAGTFLEAGWDFMEETENGAEDIWWILEGQDYPRLWWEESDL